MECGNGSVFESCRKRQPFLKTFEISDGVSFATQDQNGAAAVVMKRVAEHTRYS